MGIAKNIKNLQPGEATGDESWNASHSTSGNGSGSYMYNVGDRIGAVPYGTASGGTRTQRDAVAHVSQRIRATVNNRSKSERRAGRSGTRGEPGLTSL